MLSIVQPNYTVVGRIIQQIKRKMFHLTHNKFSAFNLQQGQFLHYVSVPHVASKSRQ
jgi:hypothetical protein